MMASWLAKFLVMREVWRVRVVGSMTPDFLRATKIFRE